MCYSLHGKLIWSKAINVSLANDDIYFQNNGSQIYVGWWTSVSHLIYDLNGNQIG